MTNLTEQLATESLPEYTEFYVRKKDGSTDTQTWLNRRHSSAVEWWNTFNITEVLAPVPSYDGWKQLKEYERIVKSYYGKPIDYDIACETVNKLLDEKNFLKEEISAYKRLTAQLKELLKGCESFIQYYQETYGAMDLDTYTLLAKLKEVLK